MQLNLIRRTCILAAIFSLMPSALLAVDAVYRKSNTTPAQGTVTSVSKTEIKVKPRIGNEVSVPISDIEQVRWDGEPAALNLSRSSERSGYFDKAIEGYQKASTDYAGDSKYLKEVIEFLVARATGKAALADPQRSAEAVQLLEGFKTSHADSFRYFECLYYLGEVYMAMKDVPKAKAAFDEMEQSPLRAYKMTARVSNARLLLNEGKISEAQALFAAVANEQTTDASELSRKYEAMLGKAACEQQGQQFDAAIKTLETVIDQVPPSDTKTLAEAYVLQGNCFRDQNKIKEAVLAYLHVDVLFSNEKTLHPQALYQLARLWSTVGHPERGAEAESKLTTEYPNNEWAQKLQSGN